MLYIVYAYYDSFESDGGRCEDYDHRRCDTPEEAQQAKIDFEVEGFYKWVEIREYTK